MEKANDVARIRTGEAALEGEQHAKSAASAVRALFIPLRSTFYFQFASGVKTDELRRYGPRWNERVCAIDRPVVLSCGYGKANRTKGRIIRFKKQHGSTFGSTYKASIEKIYGTLDVDIACITIEVDGLTL